jgi:hypothetical protein
LGGAIDPVERTPPALTKAEGVQLAAQRFDVRMAGERITGNGLSSLDHGDPGSRWHRSKAAPRALVDHQLHGSSSPMANRGQARGPYDRTDG